MENLLEDISFNAGNIPTMTEVVIDKNFVIDKLGVHNKERDLKKYIL
jgi:ATP-dependent protease HslVU (ClpYQ) ATPase subunit